MINNSHNVDPEFRIRRLQSTIENLKYDRDIVLQQKETIPYGFLHKKELDDKLSQINEKISTFQRELEQHMHNIFHSSSVTTLISILFVASDPTDLSRLRLGEESREIQEKLQLAQMRDKFVLHQRMSVRPTDLTQALLDIQPQIVHFSGHGTTKGALCFEDKSGKVHPVSPSAIAALFEQFAGQVKCVLLNACYSETQARALIEHVDCVIGMSKAIGDEAAIAFAIGFYQALGAGRTPEEAYKLGVVQIRLQNIPEHLTPVMIVK